MMLPLGNRDMSIMLLSPNLNHHLISKSENWTAHISVLKWRRANLFALQMSSTQTIPFYEENLMKCESKFVNREPAVLSDAVRDN